MIIKEVEQAEATIARIRGKKTEAQLIEEQLELMEDEPEKEEREHRQYCHTMDGITSCSHIYTSVGFGLNPDETTLTRFSERKKR